MTFTLSPSRILLALLAISPVLAVDRVAQAWYAGWHSGEFPPSKVSWSKYTHMTYAFAIPQEDWTVLSLNASNGPDGLTAFVKEAKAHNVKAIVSIGGWTGSRYISSAVGSPQNRTQFVKTVTDFATKFGLDGIDMNWQYPDRQGLSCNIINPNDTANLVAFLEELRADPVGSKLILSAATSIQPYNSKDGKPSVDLSKFGNALDWMTLMVYDIWGPWSSTVGANGPLNETCAAASKQQGSGISAVNAWTNAGVPREKILFGLPGYGHGYTVRKKDAFVNGSTTKLVAYPPFDAANRPKGDNWDAPAGVDLCGMATPVGGIFTYRGLIEEGYLQEDGTPEFPSRFDQCSQGAFVYNPDKEIMVAYDSATSYSAKGAYIASAGLRGFAIWEAAGDHNDTLLDAVRRGIGM